MAKQPRNQPPRQPTGPVVAVNIQITDAEPIVRLVSDLATLYERMSAGRLSIDRATEELGRVLAVFQGTTM